MIFQRLNKVCNGIAENLFNRLIDRTDQSKLTSLLRQCVKLHPFTHALYQYRIGNTCFARELTARLRPRTGFERRFCARILEISRIVERGYEAEIPVLSVPVFWNRSVLLALHYSLPYDPAGYAIRSHSILTHLQRRGLNVLAVTRPGYPWDLVQHAGKPFHAKDIVDGLHYFRLTSNYNMLECIDSEYINEYASKLAEIAQDHGISILHSASNFLNGLATAQAARIAGRKSIYEVRGLWHLSQAVKEPGFESTDHYLYYEIMERAASQEADAVVTISEALKDRLVHTGVKSEKITVIPNAVDLNIFKPMSSNVELKKRLGLEGRTVVGFIGSLTGYEGLDLLINAVSAVVNRGANLALLIIGHGYAEKALKKIAYSNPHKDCIRFVGHVPFDDIKKYYSIIDIFPFPRNGCEVCRLSPPLKVLEAMATAKPVIVSDLPPLLEMVKDGENGFVCKADDLQSLITTIQRLYENPGERLAIGEAARKWVVENRSWEDMSEKYIHLYWKICEDVY